MKSHNLAQLETSSAQLRRGEPLRAMAHCAVKYGHDMPVVPKAGMACCVAVVGMVTMVYYGIIIWLVVWNILYLPIFWE